MRKGRITRDDRFGFVHPGLDVHTLGITSIAQILSDCGFQSFIADAVVCEAVNKPHDSRNADIIRKWVMENRITILGFSYRLDPNEGATLFAGLNRELKAGRLFSRQGGRIRAVYFAGLPETCERIRKENPDIAGVFCGDEAPAETLRILGVNPSILPRAMLGSIGYDEDRLSFGKRLIQSGAYRAVKPVKRDGYAPFGTGTDTLIARLQHGIQRGLPPLMRAHVGPYLPDRDEAVRLFLDWCRQLAGTGFLDILSIGTSQFTQSCFGEDWGDKPNGGGVPIKSIREYAAAWQASRPMLVRTYAGTRNIPELARIHEEAINIAWHALSFWWFCRIDGRGPYSVRENLQQHIAALRYISSTGKPFEANVPHHFAFRGADDVTCVVSAVIAARVAKVHGVRHFILQNMLNTPKYTWGVQDLAKSRAMLQLVREMEDERFHVILQPRGGLDHFSHDLDKARAQLAAVTALMDDIEPHDSASPPVIHVVSYCEASRLADPAAVDESIKITRHALEQYRKMRARGQIDDMTRHPEVVSRTNELLAEARTVLAAIESSVPDACTPEGLYRIFAGGFLPVPYLWECRGEFKDAVRWQTRPIRGSIRVVDGLGKPLAAAERMLQVRGTN